MFLLAKHPSSSRTDITVISGGSGKGEYAALTMAVMLAVKMAVTMSPVCPLFVPSSVTSWKENVLKFNMAPES